MSTNTLISCQGEDPNIPSQLEAESSYDDSGIDIAIEGNGASVDIFSESGIGQAQLKLATGDWPESLILRFHLSGLESLHLHIGDSTLSVSVDNDGNVEQSLAGSVGDSQTITNDDQNWTPVRFRLSNGITATTSQADGVIELDVHAAHFDNKTSSFILNWIDFYR